MTREMYKYYVNQRFTRPDGAIVKILIIRDGEIYFVGWLQEQETGTALRMSYADFTKALEKHGMLHDDKTREGRDAHQSGGAVLG